MRIERQVGGAGLEDADQADQHLGRALDAEPDHGLGADAERAQMVRQLVGVGVERRVGQRALLEHHRDGVRRAAGLRAQTAPAAAQPATGRAVSFQPSRMVARSAPSSTGSGRAAARRPRATACSSRKSRSPKPPTVPRSNRSAAYSSTPSSPAPARSAERRSVSATDRSNFARHRLDRLGTTVKPRQLRRAAPPPLSQTPASPGTADAATATAPG